MENPDGFYTLIMPRDWEEMTPVLRMHAVKQKAEAFSVSCNNLRITLKSGGTLKSIAKDIAAERLQRRRDMEEHEGHLIPDPNKALPGII